MRDERENLKAALMVGLWAVAMVAMLDSWALKKAMTMASKDDLWAVWMVVVKVDWMVLMDKKTVGQRAAPTDLKMAAAKAGK